MSASEPAAGRLEVLVVPGQDQAVGHVRRSFRQLLGERHPALLDVQLCVSEVMTNALRHTASGRGGKVRVETLLSGAEIRVEITDDGGAAGPPEVLTENGGVSGRGLRLVAEIADSWGFEPAGDGRTTVWFAVRLCP